MAVGIFASGNCCLLLIFRRWVNPASLATLLIRQLPVHQLRFSQAERPPEGSLLGSVRLLCLHRDP